MENQPIFINKKFMPKNVALCTLTRLVLEIKVIFTKTWFS